MDFDSALSASIAPGTAKAGLVIRAVINMGSRSCHIGWIGVGHRLDRPNREDVTRADWTIRRAPSPPARRGHPDPRLARRGRRRAPGGVDPRRPRGRQRGREHRRLADDGRLARLPDACSTRASRRREEALEAGRLPDPVITRPRARRPTPRARRWPPTPSAPRCSSSSSSCTPAERLAFVLHDIFAVPFEDVARVLDRTPASARQLASRARRRVRGGDRDAPTADRAVVDAFHAAARRRRLRGPARHAPSRRGPAHRRRRRRAADRRGRSRRRGQRALLRPAPRRAPGDGRRRRRARRHGGRHAGRGARASRSSRAGSPPSTRSAGPPASPGWTSASSASVRGRRPE